MNNWKHYAGSVLLAGLLLQGCSDAPTEDGPAAPLVETEAQKSARIAKAEANEVLVFLNNSADPRAAKLAMSVSGLEKSDKAEEFVKNALAQLVVDGVVTQEDIETFTAEHDLNKEFIEALNASGAKTAANGAAQRGFFSSITDKIKDGLIDALDSSVGNAITSAAFDVVLNSEGVTVFMLDLARQSDTIAQVMLDAIGADWSLVNKMAPMLRTNKEFGEKFAALAFEYKPMGAFFFANIDRTDDGKVPKALMYSALTDAMLLSSNEGEFGSYDDAVNNTTTGYMGLLMEEYAVDYFINPAAGKPTTYGNTNAFALTMMDTGALVTLDGNVTTGHGDANELINEQFFYAMFKTPSSTDSFVVAMDKVQKNAAPTATMFMDNIFMGQGATEQDTVQGYYNIISIAGGMYEGVEQYGFASYTDAFIGFAKLIPSDRYFTYGKQFMSAGYFWAEQNGVDVWGSVVDGAKGLYADYTAPTPSAARTAAARSGGLGTIGSDWIADTLSVVGTAWDGLKIDLWPADGFIAYYNAEAMKAYGTVIGSPLSPYTTTLKTGEEVAGFHGLLELAIREDMIGKGGIVDMNDAIATFQLPAFTDITWDFAYQSATDGVTAYWNNDVSAKWLADLSTNELIREYFYPNADNVYIPSWMLAIDWLKLPHNATQSGYETMDFDFDAGYVDIYVVSTNPLLIDSLNLPDAVDPVKTITMEKVTMDTDSIIAVDAEGNDINGLSVYKIRVVSAADTEAVLAYLGSLGDSALNAIGIDTDNAAQTTTAP